MLAIMPSLTNLYIETAEPPTASCHLEINQLGVQHEAVIILSLQLCPSATAAQTLDNYTQSSTHDRITDLPFIPRARARSVLVDNCVKIFS